MRVDSPILHKIQAAKPNITKRTNQETLSKEVWNFIKNLFPWKRIIWLAGSHRLSAVRPRGFCFIYVVSSRFGHKTLSWYSTYLNWLEFSCIRLEKILVTDILEISREVLVATWCRPNPFARYLSQNFLLGRHLPQRQIMGRAEEWNWRYYMCYDLCEWNKAE